MLVTLLYLALYDRMDYSPPGSVVHGILQARTLESETESCLVVFNSLQPNGLDSPWNSPGQNNGVGSHFLLQGIFLTQGSNLGLLHCWQILYHLSYERSPGSQYSWVLMRALFLACRWTDGFNHVLMLRGERSLSFSPYKSTNPIKKPCFITQYNPNYPLKVSTLNIITWRASTHEFGREVHIVYSSNVGENC